MFIRNNNIKENKKLVTKSRVKKIEQILTTLGNQAGI